MQSQPKEAIVLHLQLFSICVCVYSRPTVMMSYIGTPRGVSYYPLAATSRQSTQTVGEELCMNNARFDTHTPEVTIQLAIKHLSLSKRLDLLETRRQRDTTFRLLMTTITACRQLEFGTKINIPHKGHAVIWP